MTDGPASEITKQQRTTMIELIEATMPRDAAVRVMSWRIDAKVAQSKLLNSAHFSNDPAEAIWLSELSQARLDECRSLLLS